MVSSNFQLPTTAAGTPLRSSRSPPAVQAEVHEPQSPMAQITTSQVVASSVSTDSGATEPMIDDDKVAATGEFGG